MSDQPENHNTHRRQTSLLPEGFESAILVGEPPQSHALDRAASGVGIVTYKQDYYQNTCTNI